MLRVEHRPQPADRGSYLGIAGELGPQVLDVGPPHLVAATERVSAKLAGHDPGGTFERFPDEDLAGLVVCASRSAGSLSARE